MLVMVLWLLSIVVLVFGTLAVLGKIFGGTKKDPIEILNMRYAKGEITKEEYEQIKKAMKEEQ